ncbi:MAG: hypothetical protein AAFV43_01290 [Planctomycetota bacterium]
MKAALVRRMLAAMIALGAVSQGAARKPDGVLVLQITDAGTDESVPARIELTDARGRSVRTRGWGLAALGAHAYLPPAATLGLRRGAYRFSIDAGPEYRTQRGHFQIDRHAEDAKAVPMRRFAHMADEGWIGVDLQHARDADGLELVRRVERVAGDARLTHRWNGDGWEALADVGLVVAHYTGERGSAWLYSTDAKLSAEELPDLSRSVATPLAGASAAGWRVVADPTSAELPVWLASECVDALWLIDGASPNDYDAGVERMKAYYEVLNAGVRVPPLGGSGSGLPLGEPPRRRTAVMTRPLGDGRTWLRGVDEDESIDHWATIQLGQTVVSNGPLLRPTANGRWPGATLPDSTDALIGLNLATRAPVEYLEIIADGEKALTVPLRDWAARGGRLPALPLAGRTWFVVRAVTVAEDRLQMAHSGPWYVDTPNGPPAAEDVRPMLRRLADAAARFGAADPEAYQAAKAFWTARNGGG